MKTIKTVEEIQDLVEGYNALLKPQFQMDEAGIICLLNDVPDSRNLLQRYVRIPAKLTISGNDEQFRLI